MRPGDLDVGELARIQAEVDDARIAETAPALDKLIAFAHHSDYLVRIHAIKALGTEHFRNTEQGAAELRAAVNDEHWLVRSFAVKALAKKPDPTALQVLEARAKVEKHERVQRYLRESIATLRAQTP